jgi:hypothetical protein
MNKILNELTVLKDSIDEAKTHVATLKGRKEEALKSLKIYKLNTVKEAKTWAAKILVELEKENKIINKGLTILKENYDW